VKAEQLALALRPRSGFEAADLGVRMVQAAHRSLLRAWLPLALLLVLACGATVELAPWAPPLLLMWAKPLLEGPLLRIFARLAFGESTTLAQLWRGAPAPPRGHLLRRLLWARLSPVRAFTLPVALLEGQPGTARRRRQQQLLQGQYATAFGLQFTFSLMEWVLMLGGMLLAVAVVPELEFGDLLAGTGLGNGPARSGGLAALGTYLPYALAVVFLEPFFIAAGFGLYLNRRVELEAWDVEQALRDAFAVPDPAAPAPAPAPASPMPHAEGA